MNDKFNKNEKVEKFTNTLGIAVRLIVIDPLFSRSYRKSKSNMYKEIIYWRAKERLQNIDVICFIVKRKN